MSTWSVKTFENEEARDWLEDLIDEHDVYFIHNTLEIIVDYPRDEKPETWDCCCALAAAEMVAAARGNPSGDLPSQAREWLDAYGLDVDGEVMALTRRAIDRIQGDSSLKDEVEAEGGLNHWQTAVADLRRRLGLS